MFDNRPKTLLEEGTILPGNEPQRPSDPNRVGVIYKDQVFDPDIHTSADMGRYIAPYEGQLVIDRAQPNALIPLIVKHVDEHGTWKTTYTPAQFTHLGAEEDDYNLYPTGEFGYLPGELALAIDYSVRPPVARADIQATAPNAAYALLYLAEDMGNPDKVISACYSGMEIITNKIPVSPVIFDSNIENKVIVSTDTFSVTLPKEAMPNGTRVYLIYYDQDGRYIKHYPMRVMESSYLRDHQLTKRYVKSIELLCPWFTNSTNPNTIYLPVNVKLITVEFRARIRYSDGSESIQPVNGYDGVSGFHIQGIGNYSPEAPNQTGDIILTYKYKEHESAALAKPGQPDHESVAYEIVAIPAEGAYSPRLYQYPYWDNIRGWVIKHWLTDLDRKFCRDVGEVVVLNSASPVFDGKRFGEEQNLIFNLTLSDVSPIYTDWTFKQNVTITLFNTNLAAGRKWEVKHSYNKPAFKNPVLEVKQVTNTTQKSGFKGYATEDEFLDACYYAFDPMYDVTKEEKPIRPTHFLLVKVNGESRECSITQYKELPLTGMSIDNGETVFMQWVYRDDTGNDLQLGVSAAQVEFSIAF